MYPGYFTARHKNEINPVKNKESPIEINGYNTNYEKGKDSYLEFKDSELISIKLHITIK